VGAAARYLLSRIPMHGFPWMTLAINVAGAFFIGFLAGLMERTDLPARLVLFVKAGVLGGFTTFSAFALESGDLIAGGHSGLAALYMAASLVLAVPAVFAGRFLAQLRI
jgi:CrcB protein